MIQSHLQDPERNLWIAVMQRAYDDLLLNPDNYGNLNKKKEVEFLKEKTVSWVKEQRASIGSFSWICGALDLSIEEMRKLMLEYKEREVHDYLLRKT